MFGGSLPPQYARIVQNAVRGAASHKYAGSGDPRGIPAAMTRPLIHPCPRSTSITVSHRRPSTRRTKPCSRRTSPSKTWTPAMPRPNNKTMRRTPRWCRRISMPACERWPKVKRHVKRDGRRRRAGALRILFAESAWRSRREPRGTERAEITMTQGLEPPPLRRDQHSEATPGARWRIP